MLMVTWRTRVTPRARVPAGPAPPGPLLPPAINGKPTTRRVPTPDRQVRAVRGVVVTRAFKPAPPTSPASAVPHVPTPSAPAHGVVATATGANVKAAAKARLLPPRPASRSRRRPTATEIKPAPALAAALLQGAPPALGPAGRLPGLAPLITGPARAGLATRPPPRAAAPTHAPTLITFPHRRPAFLAAVPALLPIISEEAIMKAGVAPEAAKAVVVAPAAPIIGGAAVAPSTPVPV